MSGKIKGEISLFKAKVRKGGAIKTEYLSANGFSEAAEMLTEQENKNIQSIDRITNKMRVNVEVTGSNSPEELNWHGNCHLCRERLRSDDFVLSLGMENYDGDRDEFPTGVVFCHSRCLMNVVNTDEATSVWELFDLPPKNAEREDWEPYRERFGVDYE